jgi:hypothetical protein
MYEASPPRPQPVPAPRGTSRRWFLVGGVAVLLGGGAGALAGELTRSTPTPAAAPLPPAALIAAVRAERALIADLDATTGGTPEVRRVIVAARADHAAHLATLTAILRAHHRTPGETPARRVRGTPRTRAQLRAAEEQAARAAARCAASLDGAEAAVLASIAACEATHAELLR